MGTNHPAGRTPGDSQSTKQRNTTQEYETEQSTHAHRKCNKVSAGPKKRQKKTENGSDTWVGERCEKPSNDRSIDRERKWDTTGKQDEATTVFPHRSHDPHGVGFAFGSHAPGSREIHDDEFF
mmetsp:Transcript_7615/g.15664  ORF Transcript_7615/g.15664 Transcript_7615/m.15664 type:complete len:123 (+) Transcript_7615:477-845(+)